MNNIKKQILATFIILCTLQSFSQKFKEEQMKNERVKASYSETWMSLRTELTMQGLNKDNFEIAGLIRVLKLLNFEIKSERKLNNGFASYVYANGECEIELLDAGKTNAISFIKFPIFKSETKSTSSNPGVKEYLSFL